MEWYPLFILHNCYGSFSIIAFYTNVSEAPIACKKYGVNHNNNCAERDNERIKQRYKITRGFKNSDSAEDFLRLLDNCYNFVNPHMSLGGKTPAEEAGINLTLERNKLMGLIKLFHYTFYGEFFSETIELLIPIIRQYPLFLFLSIIPLRKVYS